MKKLIKNPIFMFILGAIIFSSITVIATNIVASDVTYSDTTVDAALDNLYSKAKPTYTGNITFTPSDTIQTILTNNKVMTSDITINAIPSTYKNLTTTTDVDSSKLLGGVKAYSNDGELITGNLSTDCVYSSYVKAANTQLNINFGITPSTYVIWYKIPSVSVSGYITYDKSVSKISNVVYNSGTGEIWDGAGVFMLNNSVLTTNLSTTGNLYKSNTTIYYMACK